MANGCGTVTLCDCRRNIVNHCFSTRISVL